MMSSPSLKYGSYCKREFHAILGIIVAKHTHGHKFSEGKNLLSNEEPDLIISG